MSAPRRLRNLLLVAGLLAGCATTLPPPREVIPPAALRGIELLTERWREFKDLRTLADVEIQRGRDRQQMRAVVLARAPASVRFEALSPMGQPLLIATIHDPGVIRRILAHLGLSRSGQSPGPAPPEPRRAAR